MRGDVGSPPKLPAAMGLDEFLRLPVHDGERGKLRHIVVTQEDRIVGVLRVNTGLRKGLEGTYTGVTLGDVANHEFTLARPDDVMFNVIGRMWRRKSTMAVVAGGEARVPRADDVLGLITKEHVADSVAESIRPYAATEQAAF